MRTSAGLLLVGWTLVTAPTVAWAESPATVFLEELTWTEVRDLIRSGTTTIILPTGGTEQNGPHMALGKHNARVKALSATIARTLGRTLVAPVLAYVPEGGLAPPTGHMRYPGTITLPEPGYEGVLEAAARSFALHGFRDIVFLGDSGGNQAGQEAVARRLNRAWAGMPTRVHAVDAYYQASTAGARALFRSRGYSDSELGAHAGALDTSLMLAVDPGLVRQDRLRAARDLGAGEGADGDPSRASAELGRTAVEAIVSQSVEAIRRALVQRDTAPGRSHP
jgi:creatinine amidohydrolase